MKKIIFLALVSVFLFSCQKEQDCSGGATCIYKVYDFYDCTPNSDSLGYRYDEVWQSVDTFETWRCPEDEELIYNISIQKTISDPNTDKNLKEFLKQYPSSCECF
jgi:hypothetical protein